MWLLKHNWIMFDLLQHLGKSALPQAELEQKLSIIPASCLTRQAVLDLFHSLARRPQGNQGLEGVSDSEALVVYPVDLAEVSLFR